MLAFAEWDEDRHSHITAKPLKGESVVKLQDALRFMEQYVSPEAIERQILEHVAPEKRTRFKSAIQPSVAVMRQLLTETRSMLSAPGAEEFGVDYADFKGMISRICHDPVFTLDEGRYAVNSTGNSIQQIRETSVTEDEAIKKSKHEIADLIEKLMARYLMGTFSMALAVQEGRVNEYAQLSNQMVQDLLKQGYLQVQEHIAAIDDPAVDKKKLAASSFITQEAMLLGYLQEIRNGKHPFIDTYEEIMFGRDHKTGQVRGVIESMRHYLALALDIDPDTKLGQQQLAQFEEATLKQLFQEMGRDIPLPPDRKGRAK